MVDNLLTIAELILAVIAINGIIYGIFRNVIKKPIKTFCDKIENIRVKTESTHTKIHEDVLPFITSFQQEFSVNSGKSLKDKIIRIDNAIKKEELRSKIIADNLSTIGTYECDENGECIWANKALCGIFGLTFEEIMGQGWLRAICEDSRNEVWKHWLETINLHIPYEVTFRICNSKSGEIFNCRSVAVAHRDSAGKVLGYYGTLIRI